MCVYCRFSLPTSILSRTVNAPKVFISYSHDTPEHTRLVLQLANALRGHGVDVELDQYHVRPQLGWPRWCEEQLRPENAAFVLVISSDTYLRRVEGRTAADEGRGVFWEGGVIYSYLYNEKENNRFIPVLLPGAKEDDIPRPLRDGTRYHVNAFDLVDSGYQALYRELTGQLVVTKPRLGEIVPLPPDALSRVHPLSPLPPRQVMSRFIPAVEDHLEGAPDSSMIVGRQVQEKELTGLLTNEQCRFVAIHGLWGIGKSTLAAKVVRTVAGEFDATMWVSLKDGLPRHDTVALMTSRLAPDAPLSKPGEPDFQPLLRALAHRKALVVLDNAESLLDPTGTFLPQYSDYAELFSQLASTVHRSTILVTTREKFGGVLLGAPIKWVELLGLDGASIRTIIERTSQSFSGREGTVLDSEWRSVASRIGGNPLASNLLAPFILGGHGGRINEFLEDSSPLPHLVETLIDWHFGRLSSSEGEVLNWLAALREQSTAVELRAYVLDPEVRERVHETLGELSRRLLVERAYDRVWLQPVILEQATTRFVARAVEELKGEAPLNVLEKIALLAASKDHVRDAQRRLRLDPIVARVKAWAGSPAAAHDRLLWLLDECRVDARSSTTYLPVNLLHLFGSERAELRDLNFSQLVLRFPFLREISTVGVDFSNTNFIEPNFAQTFGNARAVAISPDGRLVATVGTDGYVRIWTFPKLVLQKTFGFGNLRKVLLSLAFSTDGKMLAWGDDKGVLYLREIASAKTQTFDAGAGGVMTVAFNPVDSGVVAAGYVGSLAVLWRVGFPPVELTNHAAKVPTVAFSQDGRYLATGCEDSNIRLWDGTSGEHLELWKGDKERVFALAFDHTGRLVSGGEDGVVRIWPAVEPFLPTQPPRLAQLLNGHQGRVRAVAVTHDGLQIASGGEDGTIRIWDSTGDSVVTIRRHSNRIRSIDFDSTGGRIVSVADDQTIRLWDVASGLQVHSVIGRTASVKGVALVPPHVQPEGNVRPLLVSGGEDGHVRVWSAVDGAPVAAIAGHIGPVWTVAVSPDRRFVASGGEDQMVRLWRLDEGTGGLTALDTGLPHHHRVSSVAFSPDGRFLASGSEDQSVRVWDLDKGRPGPTRELALHLNGVTSIAFDPGSKYLLSGSDDHTMRLWDCDSWLSASPLIALDRRIDAVAISPTGELIAAGGDGGRVAIWNVADRSVVATTNAYGPRVLSLTFSENGAEVVIGYDDGTITFVNAITAEQSARLHDVGGAVNSLCWIAGRESLAVGSEKHISVWRRTQHWERCWFITPERFYERTRIVNATGITDAQREALEALGAIS